MAILTIASELSTFDVKSTADEYVWQSGTVIANELSGERRSLRVEISAEGDDPPHVYDISLDGHGDWAKIAVDDTVRIQTQLDGAENIKKIIRVEPIVKPVLEPSQ